MKRFLLLLAILGAMGVDCGPRPTSLNLVAMAVEEDQGASLKLQWDMAPDAERYVIYRDGQIIDTLIDEYTYTVDSTGIGSRFEVVAEGARLTDGVSLEALEGSAVLYDPSAGPCVLVIDPTTGQGSTQEAEEFSGVAWVVVSDTMPGYTGDWPLYFVNPKLEGIRGYTYYSYTVNTIAPFPDKEANYEDLVPASPGAQYTLWVDLANYGEWDRGDYFVIVRVDSVDAGGGVYITYWVQSVPGLRWFP